MQQSNRTWLARSDVKLQKEYLLTRSARSKRSRRLRSRARDVRWGWKMLPRSWVTIIKLTFEMLDNKFHLQSIWTNRSTHITTSLQPDSHNIFPSMSAMNVSWGLQDKITNHCVYFMQVKKVDLELLQLIFTHLLEFNFIGGLIKPSNGHLWTKVFLLLPRPRALYIKQARMKSNESGR